MRGLKKAFRILRRARERGHSPQRTAKEWKRLRKIAADLFRLLRDLFPRWKGDEPGNGGSGGRRSGGGDVVDVLEPWHRAAVRAAARRAALAEQAASKPSILTWRRLVKPYDESSYQKVIAPFQRMAQLLAQEPTQCFQHGRTAGSRITRPVRARTDGRCFRGKAVEEDPGGAFGLVFDHSFSMRRDLGVFLPVGAALADALASAPDVEVALWRFGTGVEWVEKTDNLKDIQLMGGTRTDVALDAALRWIETQPATEKAIVVFTDGAPCEKEKTIEACVALRRQNVRLLVGSA